MSWKRPSLLALFIASMACWLERQAASQIEYLKAENRALRSRLGRRRILFCNAERRTLGNLAKEVGSKALSNRRIQVLNANRLERRPGLAVAGNYSKIAAFSASDHPRETLI